MPMGAEEGGGRFPPPAAAAIAISSIAVSSIVTNLSTDHVPAVAVVQRCCVCPNITVMARGRRANVAAATLSKRRSSS